MIAEVKKAWGAYQAAKDGRSLAIVVGPENCDRNCSYCNVKKNWNPQTASTVDETCRQIDRIHQLGYRVLNDLGGETLATCPRIGTITSGKYIRCPYGMLCAAEDPKHPIRRATEEPFRTKEGFTFAEHATEVIAYASKLGMVTNITTNGDFLTPENYSTLKNLGKAGLDFMIISDHTRTARGFKNLVAKARAVANEGIVPMVSRVFTAERADSISLYARTCIANGILFTTSIVQEIGGGFSTVPVQSQIPTEEQIQQVFQDLLDLKRTGFVRNNSNYLTKAQQYPGNSWKCNPEIDPFIHVRAVGEKGEVGVCPEARTGFDTTIDLDSNDWRQIKREQVKKCQGCLYSCYFECEDPDFMSDLPTLLPIILIKAGQAGIARWLGRRAVEGMEILEVPQSKLENWQARCKSYDSFTNRVVRKVDHIVGYAIGYAAIPFIFAALFSYLAYDAIKEKVSSRRQ
ncbi:hypothetical protein HY383_02560 [Candidatus Daviesbacteria bacterium]|nr:hypothetical protein [Candidatus Daviesbacteria bacterium]